MVVRFKGATSSQRSLPGGGPPGTLLGLLLCIVLINDIGFNDQQNNVGEIITCRRNLRATNQLHLKFVENLTMAESLILKDSVKTVPITDRPHPDPYHARTRHALIPNKSKVYSQIMEVNKYANTNEMKLKLDKTKFMIFNSCSSIDCMPTFSIGGTEINLLEEMKLLGLIITSDPKFSKNTDYIVKKAFKRIWMLKRLKNLGSSDDQLIDVK